MANPPPLNTILFESDEQMRQKLKSYGIAILDIHKKPKQFYYKGIKTNGEATKCKPLGIERHNNYETLVIQIETISEPCLINFEYFKEMQSEAFSLIYPQTRSDYMNFTALYIEIDNDFYKQNGDKKSYSTYITSISVAQYKNTNLLYSNTWYVNPPNKERTKLPYLHECWHEIEPYLFNQTVILHLANFFVEHLLKTQRYICTTTVKNPVYNPDKPDTPDNPKSISKFPDAFMDCVHSEIRFDYLCIFQIISRLYIDIINTPYNLNSFSDICESAGVMLSENSKAVALGEVFIKIMLSVGANDILHLKHLAGITFGEVCKNISYRLNSNEKTKENNPVVEYDKMYRPCLPIIEENTFRKYTYNLKEIDIMNNNTKLNRFLPNEYCVLDIETTGFSYKDDIIEVAALKIQNNAVVDTFQSLIAFDMQKTNLAVHKNNITDDMLTNAPPLKPTLEKFFSFIGNNVLVGHNIATFDISRLVKKAEKYNLDFSKNDYIDIQILSEQLIEQNLLKNNSYSAESLADYWKIDYSNAHRALNDCYIEFEIFKHLGLLDCKRKPNFESCSNTTTDKTSVSKTKNLDLDSLSNLDWSFFKGKHVAATGDFRLGSRSKIIECIKNVGGFSSARGDISENKTDLLLSADKNKHRNTVDENGNEISKKEKIAKENQIEIIDETQFYKIIGYQE